MLGEEALEAACVGAVRRAPEAGAALRGAMLTKRPEGEWVTIAPAAGAKAPSSPAQARMAQVSSLGRVASVFIGPGILGVAVRNGTRTCSVPGTPFGDRQSRTPSRYPNREYGRKDDSRGRLTRAPPSQAQPRLAGAERLHRALSFRCLDVLMSPRGPHVCPECGERVSAFAAGCALCGADLDPQRGQAPPSAGARLRALWASARRAPVVRRVRTTPSGRGTR